MVVHLASAAARAACDAINALVNHDWSAGTPSKLRIYDGTRPVNADTAPTGSNNILIEFSLPNPLFQASALVGNAAVAQLNASGVAPVTAAKTGTASFFIITDGDGTTIMDGQVTDTSGSGDLKLSTVSVVVGIDVSVVSLTASMPNGL